MDRSEGSTTISGDLYQFLNPILVPQPPLSDLVEDVPDSPPVTPPIPIPHLPFGIPVYPRKNYYSYLKVVGIQINNRFP